MPKPPPPQSLDDLLARAEDFALFSMRSGGKVPPTLLADTPGGSILFIPSSLADERAKDNFANTARLICVAHAAPEVAQARALRHNGSRSGAIAQETVC